MTIRTRLDALERRKGTGVVHVLSQCDRAGHWTLDGQVIELDQAMELAARPGRGTFIIIRDEEDLPEGFAGGHPGIQITRSYGQS